MSDLYTSRIQLAKAMKELWMAFGYLFHDLAHSCFDRARSWEVDDEQ